MVRAAGTGPQACWRCCTVEMLLSSSSSLLLPLLLCDPLAMMFSWEVWPCWRWLQTTKHPGRSPDKVSSGVATHSASLLTGWSGGDTPVAMDCLLGFKCLLVFAGKCWKGSIHGLNCWHNSVSQFHWGPAGSWPTRWFVSLFFAWVVWYWDWPQGQKGMLKMNWLEIKVGNVRKIKMNCFVAILFLLVPWDHLRMFI